MDADLYFGHDQTGDEDLRKRPAPTFMPEDADVRPKRAKTSDEIAEGDDTVAYVDKSRDRLLSHAMQTVRSRLLVSLDFLAAPNTWVSILFPNGRFVNGVISRVHMSGASVNLRVVLSAASPGAVLIPDNFHAPRHVRL